jgi:hypothetical protein
MKRGEMVYAPHMSLDPKMGELDKDMALEFPLEQYKIYVIYSPSYFFKKNKSEFLSEA